MSPVRTAVTRVPRQQVLLRVLSLHGFHGEGRILKQAGVREVEFPVLFSDLSLAEQPFRPEEYLFLSKKVPILAVFPCQSKNMNIPTGGDVFFNVFVIC